MKEVYGICDKYKHSSFKYDKENHILKATVYPMVAVQNRYYVILHPIASFTYSDVTSNLEYYKLVNIVRKNVIWYPTNQVQINDCGDAYESETIRYNAKKDMFTEVFLKNDVGYKHATQRIVIWDKYSWTQLYFCNREIDNAKCYSIIGEDYEHDGTHVDISCAIRVGAEGTKKTYSGKYIYTVYRLDNNEGVEL